jgi:hypothetical protein
MPMEAPFDVWDGEELGLTDEVTESAAEEVAMHVDPDSEVPADGVRWSELTDGEEVVERVGPVCYFADEEAETGGNGHAEDDLAVDLGELLVRQHYMV